MNIATATALIVLGVLNLILALVNWALWTEIGGIPALLTACVNTLATVACFSALFYA